MGQFVAVIREFRNWVNSIPVLSLIMPFHYYLMFAGLVVMTVNSFFFHWSVVYAIGHYTFFTGAWLTLASGQYRLFPFALWGYGLYHLFPLKFLSIYDVSELILYGFLGYGVLKLDAYLAGRGLSID